MIAPRITLQAIRILSQRPTGMYGAKLKETDNDVMDAYIEKYRREKPLSHVSEAAMALVVELAERQ